MQSFSHQVAVAGLIVKESKILLLHRTTQPYIWAPPGGRLFKNENPYAGLEREIWEECQIEVKPLKLITLWVGEHKGSQLLALTFLCEFIRGEIILSEEHTNFEWVNPHEFQKKNFKFAESLYLVLLRIISMQLNYTIGGKMSNKKNKAM